MRLARRAGACQSLVGMSEPRTTFLPGARVHLSVWILLISLARAFAETPPPVSFQPQPEPDAFALNSLIGRGINIGNALEGPSEGEWGVTVREEFFDIIHRAGFSSVRIPVCWSAHALTREPFTIDAGFLKRIDEVLGHARARGLVVILTMHHYNELYRDPAGHSVRFLAIWRQLAERYRGYPPSLLLEPLNEPHDNLGAGAWNKLLKAVVKTIRESNPTRKLVIGPVNYNDLRQLDALDLPSDDRNLIATFHYYLPYEFTHQGAHWAPGSERWLGTRWNGSNAERKVLESDFQAAADWAKRHNRPVFLGEFGADSKADLESRARWIRCVAQAATARNISFTYWDFCAEFFGMYDPKTKTWRQPLLEAATNASPNPPAHGGGATGPP